MKSRPVPSHRAGAHTPTRTSHTRARSRSQSDKHPQHAVARNPSSLREHAHAPRHPH